LAPMVQERQINALLTPEKSCAPFLVLEILFRPIIHS